MLEALAQLAHPLLNIPYIRRTRRNHGLEHATITLLTPRRYRLSGRSDDSGFVILGDVPTDALERAAQEALRRMRNGEHQLAVHPNCGTNLLTTGFMASLIGLVGMAGSSRRRAVDRMPLVMLMMMGAILYGPLLGMRLQQHFTTAGDPGDLEVVSVSRREVHIPFSGTLIVHRVNTQRG